jgi:ABC-2 type transport system ATP-binding protein
MSIIEIKNLKKSYGKKPVLDIEGMKIQDGDSIGIFGANGSGKSTLIKCLTGLLPYQGSIYIDGKDISKDPSPLKDVGILVEEPALYKMLTGRENIKFFCEDTAKLDLYAKILEVEDILDMKAKSYSLGMKQKLGILLACVKGKKLVILDEPFNCLDVISIDKAISLIMQCQKDGASIILTSHQLDSSQKAVDKYYLIKDTKIYLCSDEETNNQQKVYSVEFDSFDRASSAYKFLQEKDIDCELCDLSVKIRLSEGDIFTLLADLEGFSIKKFEDISNSIKEAYIAMEMKK